MMSKIEEIATFIKNINFKVIKIERFSTTRLMMVQDFF